MTWPCAGRVSRTVASRLTTDVMTPTSEQRILHRIKVRSLKQLLLSLVSIPSFLKGADGDYVLRLPSNSSGNHELTLVVRTGEGTIRNDRIMMIDGEYTVERSDRMFPSGKWRWKYFEPFVSPNKSKKTQF